ncbi:MAG: hypothetical protein AUJ92_09075 [Armatimonadetes bacterium CG2_30_59_28]|nr:hypothetical protein [Armatimonadota bacterium]OIO94856.1 MAG: hypothetical protein AUJ92_09075 [Armatimonadetes bacterium CG2_30_59_28]PIU65928.1 MAG: hypothetical protein COS85_07030 [Armatimonadetes bacterium CG07_land_8_20_14_0_80_59_28]PIY39073.1 MAG: hypothetical protein COZ05_19760 [Armatimonadetes bacterium CG_4_10_14_3_um_filter_59_10]
MPFMQFDRSRLQVLPLADREHDMHLSEVVPLDAPLPNFDSPRLNTVAERIGAARQKGSAVILMVGAHVIKVGMSRFVIDLMERGCITHVAMNGAGPIHDYELALIGATTESVARYIRSGHFGLWKETGRINDIVRGGAQQGMGYGESLGRYIADNALPHSDVSILAAGARLGIPVTVHIGIGYDIIHEHPNCDAAALGQASYTDFLIFAHSVSQLEGGVFLNFGTSVMGPEVYLKALSMVRNVARQEGKEVCHFTTAVFDLVDLGDDLESEAPKSDPRYYYRPFKTILVRTVADGGESYYIRGNHAVTLPTLHRMIISNG